MSKVRELLGTEESTAFLVSTGLFTETDYMNYGEEVEVHHLLENDHKDIRISMYQLEEAPDALYYPILTAYMRLCIGNFILGYAAPDVNTVAYNEDIDIIMPMFKPFQTGQVISVHNVIEAFDAMTLCDAQLGAAYLRYMSKIQEGWANAIKKVADPAVRAVLQLNYNALMYYVRRLTTTRWYNLYMAMRAETDEYEAYDRDELYYATFVSVNAVISIHEDLCTLVSEHHDYFYNTQFV